MIELPFELTEPVTDGSGFQPGQIVTMTRMYATNSESYDGEYARYVRAVEPGEVGYGAPDKFRHVVNLWNDEYGDFDRFGWYVHEVIADVSDAEHFARAVAVANGEYVSRDLPIDPIAVAREAVRRLGMKDH